MYLSWSIPPGGRSLLPIPANLDYTFTITFCNYTHFTILSFAFFIQQIKSLLKLQTIHEIQIENSIPVSMNSCRRVASHSHFVEMGPAEIVDEMDDQYVIRAWKFTKFVGGTRRSTATVILTFSTTKLPKSVYIRYETVRVRLFIPNPLRWFKCQFYGHHGNACQSSLSDCAKCAREGHTVEHCTSLVEKCCKCVGAHSTFSRDCPALKIKKDVCKLRLLKVSVTLMRGSA